MCFEAMNAVGCEEICGELMWFFATCDYMNMCCHVISCHDDVFSSYYIVGFVVV